MERQAKEGRTELVARVERLLGEMKGQKTEEEEVLARSEKLPRKMKGTRKEGFKETLARLERLA